MGAQRPGLSCGGRGGGGTLVRKNISARRLAPGVALGFRSPQVAISNLIRLLELPEEVQSAVMTKAITQGHARALLGLPDPDSIIHWDTW